MRYPHTPLPGQMLMLSRMSDDLPIDPQAELSDIDPGPSALKDELRRRDWSQETLAYEIGWTQSKVSRVLKGEQSFAWHDRLHVALVLEPPAERFGVSLRGAPSPGHVQQSGDNDHLSRAAYTAELLRDLGRPREAIDSLAEDVQRATQRFKDETSDETSQTLAALKLASALAQGDIEPDANLRNTTLGFTRDALMALSQFQDRCPPELWWRANHRHGNELRKAGDHRHARPFLIKAYDGAPTNSLKATTLIALARLQYQDRDEHGFNDSMRELRQLLEDTDVWTPDAHPVAALDNELRGAVVFDTSPSQYSDELRCLIGYHGLIPDPARMTPHWHPIWSVSVGADALRKGDIERARHVAQQALAPAEREGYERQIMGLQRVLTSVGDGATSTIDELQGAAVSVIAELR